MAFDFPASPTEGQQYTPAGGPTYTFVSPKWVAAGGSGAAMSMSDTAPVSPKPGDMWWETDSGKLFVWYDDGTSSQWVEAAGGGRGPAASGWRNRIINGDFSINQRGAAAAFSTGVSGYLVDRWFVINGAVSTPGTFTVSQFLYSSINEYAFIVTPTVVDAAVAAGDYYMFQQRIEGNDCRDFCWGTANAKPITISFEALLSGGPSVTLPVAVRNALNNRTWLGSFTANATGWTKVVLTVPGDTTGTWETGNLIGLSVSVTLAAGTTLGSGVAGWQAGNFLSMAGMTNLMGATNALAIRNFQLELGSVATEFERVDFGDQLARCQRYYEKSYDLETAPGTAADNGYTEWLAAMTYTFHRCSSSFRVSKRAPPTVALYSPTTGAVGKIHQFGVGDVNGIVSNLGQSGIVAAVNNVSLAAGVVLRYQWTASAEL